VHEYSIVEALMTRVRAEAASRNATSVHRLSVRLGELSGVDPGLLKTAYDTFRQGTICERAELDIRRLPACWVCRTCEQPLSRGRALQCELCGGPGSLAEGDEIILDQIQLEVP